MEQWPLVQREKLFNEGERFKKYIYSLTFIQESKYNFRELSFKGYKNLGSRNNKYFFFLF